MLFSLQIMAITGVRRKFPRGAKFRHKSTLGEMPKARPF